MKQKHQYISGISVQNPSDFTPKKVYEEMDRQARYYRKERLVVNILLFVAWFVTVVTALKLIFTR